VRGRSGRGVGVPGVHIGVWRKRECGRVDWVPRAGVELGLWVQVRGAGGRQGRRGGARGLRRRACQFEDTKWGAKRLELDRGSYVDCGLKR
jgi:hypothetical protein